MVDSKKISHKKDSFTVNLIPSSCNNNYNHIFNVFMKLQIKTKGQIEDYIIKEVTKYYVRTLGVGPRESKCYILEDMIIIRFQGRLLPIEENLIKMLDDSNKGIDLVKSIRKEVHSITTKQLSPMIKKLTGHKVISSHSDISTITGERIEIFILDGNFENELSLFSPSDRL